ncbi:MAG: SCO family protein [Burkholderiales bacterium]|nr:SCO family protein [Burkholderiales bacterium]
MPATSIDRRTAIAFGAAVLVAACGDRKPAAHFNATDITGAAFGRTLALKDAASGDGRTLESYRGKALVLFFGYMFCPDYCPTTMTTLNAALGKMKPEDAAKVQVAFVTVDPKRDTPAQLKSYVTAFNPTFAALYGSEAEVAAAAKEFKIIFQKAQVKDENTYLIDHSTQMYAFDPAGRLRLMIKHESGAEAIAADLTALVRG